MSTRLDVAQPISARTDRFKPRGIRKFRPDIEGLRAVAVILVVLAHLHLGFPGGYIGVDVFFVISGFLITRQLMGESDRAGRITFSGFYARRARRILPAATVVVIGTVLACAKWDSPLRVKSSDTMDGIFAAFSGINWRLASTGTSYFQNSSLPSPFQHFWSLAVEEQFYLVWPAILLGVGVMAARKNRRRASLIWVLLLIMAVSLLLSILTTRSSPSWAYFGVQTRMWELAFGALLAITVDVWTRMPPAFASQMSWLGLGLIVLSSLVYHSSTEYPGSAVIMPVVGSAFVIAGGCPGWSRSAELVLRQRPMQFLGKTSYSWYLVHWPILTILPLVIGHAMTTTDSWLVLFGSLALAVIMFYVVEQPIRTNSWLVRKPRYSLVLGGALVLSSIGVASVVVANVTIPGGSGSGQRASAAVNSNDVRDAVAASANLIRLPSDVTPSLPKAVTDRPATSRVCLVADLVTALAPESSCSFGDLSSTRVMAVVGDSHANQWTPALDAFGKVHHWKVILYAKAACSPGIYPFYIDPLTSRLYSQCNEWRDKVFSRLRILKPRVVLVASELRTMDIDPGGMVQSIRKYQQYGARVLYLEDTPNPAKVGSVPDCLALHPNQVGKCAVSPRDPKTRLSAFIQRRVESAAVRRAGATLIDPTSWFCTATICPPVINNIIVYADASHITATYARWLSPVMSAALNKAVG
jgi:peptidoglycan/LPS O-acetylase OafA/YrhL